jgi:hypothetical protein
MKESGAGTKANQSEQKTQEPHFYAGFLMKCLSELLFSYEQCRVVFLMYPKRQGQVPANKDVFARSKSSALNFLLSELVSFGTFQPEVKDGKLFAQKPLTLSLRSAWTVQAREKPQGPSQMPRQPGKSY